MIRKILKKLLILQTVSNKGRKTKLGKGFSQAYRLNPYNPLSYLLAICVYVGGVVLFGFIGIREQVDGNPFKWN